MSDLQKQAKNLEKDLRGQAESVEEVRSKLRGEYDHAFKVGRTAATWVGFVAGGHLRQLPRRDHQPAAPHRRGVDVVAPAEGDPWPQGEGVTIRSERLYEPSIVDVSLGRDKA
ncbi:hypothetical protein ACFY2R_19645 [Micromonospora olivasterospora]|uniref:hypothetical protein n=1 Tax=Micromonospora olivasterospora TaxID=1880 RepID=UPI00119FD794|nr:hypothetical protein [Micromonospora olivasterospora]